MPNLLKDLPDALASEVIETLATGTHVRIERIVSHGQSSPEGFWYDQDLAEWVVILKGEAKLRWEFDATPIHLRPGDCLMIPAHQKHRVEWTAPNQITIWLAVLYSES